MGSKLNWGILKNDGTIWDYVMVIALKDLGLAIENTYRLNLDYCSFLLLFSEIEKLITFFLLNGMA